MSARRAPRPRYGRVAALSSSVAVTLVSVLGGVGVLPPESGRQASAEAPAPLPTDPADVTARHADSDVRAEMVALRSLERPRAPRPSEAALPAGSGTGRRVVFSESAQRVWLVEASGEVAGTWLVSGSLTDNLAPGTYSVWSRSEQAWGIDDSGTMQYFVRFAHGERAAIGFHDIPVDDGELVQGVEDLGTPQSHGCIRQRRADARRMWDFARMGTTVVVTG